jgi:hypothetical protein
MLFVLSYREPPGHRQSGLVRRRAARPGFNGGRTHNVAPDGARFPVKVALMLSNEAIIDVSAA